MTFVINVIGTPSPGGSKKFVGLAKSTGRAILVDVGGQKTRYWRRHVAASGAAVMRTEMGGKPLLGPLNVAFTFIVSRPKGHRNAKGVLLPKAPQYPIKRPDVLKLTRSTEDALTGIVWADDAQIVKEFSEKRFADAGEATGVRIEVTFL